MKTLFLLSLLFIVYTYVGYPFILAILSVVRNRTSRKGEIEPTVSFIIAAYNEELRIKEKIENTLKQDYPKKKFEIIVASDGSTDMTDQIIGAYEPQGIIHIRLPERKGKENAQKSAIDISSGEILIFSDVSTILQPEGVSTIVKNFYDHTVGCVSSVDKFIDKDGKLSGEGAYVKYEMLLRALESKVNTVVGLSGSFFAARRKVCREWAENLQSDFNTVLNSIRQGLKGTSDPHSIGYYKNIADEKKEFERKIRTVIRGISVLMESLPLLNPLKYGLFSWQLLSHKLCRWLVPFAMIVLFISNVFLMISSSSVSTVWTSIFILQVVFYLIGTAGAMSKTLATKSLVKIPLFFLTVNTSIFIAWLKYLSGVRVVRWEPSRR